jgi:hypothetical protein
VYIARLNADVDGSEFYAIAHIHISTDTDTHTVEIFEYGIGSMVMGYVTSGLSIEAQKILISIIKTTVAKQVESKKRFNQNFKTFSTKLYSFLF